VGRSNWLRFTTALAKDESEICTKTPVSNRVSSAALCRYTRANTHDQQCLTNNRRDMTRVTLPCFNCMTKTQTCADCEPYCVEHDAWAPFYKHRTKNRTQSQSFTIAHTKPCTIYAPRHCAPLRSHYTNCAALPPTYPPLTTRHLAHQFVVMRHLQRSPENPDAESFFVFFLSCVDARLNLFLVSMKQAGRSNEKTSCQRKLLISCRLRSVARSLEEDRVSFGTKVLCMCLGTETSATRWFLNSN